MFATTRGLLAALACLALVGVGCAAPSGSEQGSPASATPAPSGPASAGASESAEPTGPATVNLDEVASLKLDLDGGPDWPSELDGSVWILIPDAALIPGGDEPFVYRLDAETGVEQARVTVGGRLCQGMVPAFDALWVCADDGVLRIDPATNAVVASIGFRTARVFSRLAASEDAVWSLAGNVVADSVVRIDPATNAVTATYPLGHVATGLAYGHGALWTTSPSDGLLLRIDALTGEVTEAAADLPGPWLVAAGASGVWVILHEPNASPALPGDPALARFDPATGETTLLDFGGSPGGATDIAVTDDAVWVRGSDPFLVRLDPETGETVWAVSKPGMGDGAIAIIGGAVWATSIDRGSVWRIDL